ncbi:phosphoheptose isomerase [candidate division WWE3 bacterium]|uniref:Phosphoheptose isomerase n=1 Tax=candidate division WWE3 bacterium TaxID=2053526 RepID=A0A955LGJ7_UNCKA|nr:phosphoheptose isomerase [candidate division WWE3 bacterium]
MIKSIDIDLSKDTPKDRAIRAIQLLLQKYHFRITEQDFELPWGGSIAILKDQTPLFIHQFFPEHEMLLLPQKDTLYPKFLLIAPGARISWQYHNRRKEYWKILFGPVGVITSATNDQGPTEPKEAGSLLEIGLRARHRLVGLENWAIVAEIWKHTDPTRPSDESDIVRLEDDFGRSQ